MRIQGFMAAILEAIMCVSMEVMGLINLWNYKYSNCLLNLYQILMSSIHINFTIVGDMRWEYDFLAIFHVWPWLWPWPWSSKKFKICPVFPYLFVNNIHQLFNSIYTCYKFNSNMLYYDYKFQWRRPSWTPSWISQLALT